jgi:hypothetical protein
VFFAIFTALDVGSVAFKAMSTKSSSQQHQESEETVVAIESENYAPAAVLCRFQHRVISTSSSLRGLRFVSLEASGGVLKKFFSFKWNVEKWGSCVVGNVAEQKLHNNILTIEHHRQFS